MKLEKALFKNIASLAFLRRNGAPEHRLIHPVREWAVCLLVTVSIAIGLFGYLGFEFYVQYHNIDDPQVSPRGLPIYNVNDARNIIDSYAKRKDTFDVLRSERKTALPSPQIVPAPSEEASVVDEVEPPLAGEGGEQYTDPTVQAGEPAETP